MNIEYVLKQFYGATHIPARAYSSEKGDLIAKTGFPEIDPWTENPLLLHELSDKFPHDTDFHIHTEFNTVLTIFFYLVSSEVVVLGPVCLYHDSEYLSKQYALLHRLPKGFTLPVSDWFSWNSAISLLYYMITGTEIDEQTIPHLNIDTKPISTQDNKALQEYILTISDKEQQRFSYTYEMEKMRQVKEGDIDSIYKEITPDAIRESQVLIGQMSEIPEKQWEYSVVSSIVVSSRAAIDGGLPPELSYALSDTLLQRLSHCKDFQQMLLLESEVRITFASAVKDYHSQHSNESYVEKAKNYINQHLNRSITLEDLEEVCGVTKYHLCHEFKKATGQTVIEYLQKQRIKTSKDLLRYTSHSISYIANYLCFSTQSYFSKVFKQETGQTPMQYRNGN